jgi:3-oxoacyl-[acyl-carrier protein] reductase
LAFQRPDYLLYQKHACCAKKKPRSGVLTGCAAWYNEKRGEAMSMAGVAVITGGSRGIGAAAVEAFCAAGYRVAFFYRQDEVAARALSEKAGALAIRADVSDRAQIDQAFARVRAEVGAVDVLVNNAGVAQFRLFDEISDDDWRRMMAVNLDGVFYCARAVVPGMISRKSGCILNVSSVWGLWGASCEAHYAASKGAVIALTRSLAKELGPSGIRVNCVAPGVISTGMNRELDEDALRDLRDRTPLQRLGEPDEVADVLVFLAGEGARFITGQVLGVDGGFS